MIINFLNFWNCSFAYTRVLSNPCK